METMKNVTIFNARDTHELAHYLLMIFEEDENLSYKHYLLPKELVIVPLNKTDDAEMDVHLFVPGKETESIERLVEYYEAYSADKNEIKIEVDLDNLTLTVSKTQEGKEGNNNG